MVHWQLDDNKEQKQITSVKYLEFMGDIWRKIQNEELLPVYIIVQELRALWMEGWLLKMLNKIYSLLHLRHPVSTAIAIQTAVVITKVDDVSAQSWRMEKSEIIMYHTQCQDFPPVLL